MTHDELAADPAVQQIISKLIIYRGWYEAALIEAKRLERERDSLRDELRRYVAARV